MKKKTELNIGILSSVPTPINTNKEGKTNRILFRKTSSNPLACVSLELNLGVKCVFVSMITQYLSSTLYAVHRAQAADIPSIIRCCAGKIVHGRELLMIYIYIYNVYFNLGE